MQTNLLTQNSGHGNADSRSRLNINARGLLKHRLPISTLDFGKHPGTIPSKA